MNQQVELNKRLVSVGNISFFRFLTVCPFNSELLFFSSFITHGEMLSDPNVFFGITGLVKNFAIFLGFMVCFLALVLLDLRHLCLIMDILLVLVLLLLTFPLKFSFVFSVFS